MFDKMIRIQDKKYLGYGIMMPWENNLEMQFDLWKKAVSSPKVKSLKEICGSDEIVGVFCYRCDAENRTFSYHIACENKNNAISVEFEDLKIKGGTFTVFKNVCNNYSDVFKSYNDLCDEIWGQWLPNSGYTSLIELETFGCVDGYASIELFHPDVTNVIPYRFEIWLPVEKKLQVRI